MEAVPDEVWSTTELEELDIQFLAECHQGQTVLSRSQVINNDSTHKVLHQIVRHEDNTEVARARTVWRRAKF